MDPVLHIGHATMLKSISDEDLSTALDKLMGLACFPPSTVYCDEKFSFLPTVAAFYPHIVFTKKLISFFMPKECSLFLSQFKNWTK